MRGKNKVSGEKSILATSLVMFTGLLLSSGPGLSLTNRLPVPYLALTNEAREEINEFIRHSDAVHDIVQDEVSHALGVLFAIVGFSLTSLGIMVAYSINSISTRAIKEELGKSEEEFKGKLIGLADEYKSEFHRESVELMEHTSSLLGLIVSMEDSKILSDIKFSPISTELYQTIERYPTIFQGFKDKFDVQIPVSFHTKLGDVFSLLGKYELIAADANHDEQQRKNGIKRFEDALGAYNEALEKKTGKVDRREDKYAWSQVLCKKGNTLATLKKYEQAINNYAEAFTLDSGNYWAVHSQGDALKGQGDTLISKGDIDKGLSRYEEALKKYRKALGIRNAPRAWMAETHYKIGVLYATRKDYEKAILSYEKSKELDNISSWVPHSLGDALSELGRYDEAIAAYQQALEIDPWQYKSLYAQGDVRIYALGDALYSQKGIYNREVIHQAIDDYKMASKIASQDGIDDYSVQERLGHANLRLGDLKHGFENYRYAAFHYKKAIDLGSQSFRVWGCYAYVNEQLLHYESVSDKDREERDQKISEERKKALHFIEAENQEYLENGYSKHAQANAAFKRAIYHALINHNEERRKAVEELKMAIEANEECREWAKREIGFVPMYSDGRFKKLIS